MLQIKNLLPALITALVTCQQLPFTPDLDIRREQLYVRCHTRSQWSRIAVGPHSYTASAVDSRKAHLRQIHALFRQGTQKITLAKHQCARHLSSVSDDSLFILLAASEQMLVQVPLRR